MRNGRFSGSRGFSGRAPVRERERVRALRVFPNGDRVFVV